MKAFAYIRVSGSSQVDGDGPDRQREKITNFCRRHLLLPQGVAKPEEFFDQGISGTVDGLDRPAFAEFLLMVEQQPDEYCLVVERMDRLARTLVVQEVLLAECKKRGIKVFSADRGELVDQASDGADPSVVLIRQILGAVAQWEKSVIVMKLKAAKDRIRRETGRCEGPKPYGELEEERQPLKDLLTTLDMGASLKQTAEKLNMLGHKTRSGKAWTRNRVFEVARRHKKNI